MQLKIYKNESRQICLKKGNLSSSYPYRPRTCFRHVGWCAYRVREYSDLSLSSEWSCDWYQISSSRFWVASFLMQLWLVVIFNKTDVKTKILLHKSYMLCRDVYYRSQHPAELFNAYIWKRQSWHRSQIRNFLEQPLSTAACAQQASFYGFIAAASAELPGTAGCH